jgi:FtsH-binding integral membrane protein
MPLAERDSQLTGAHPTSWESVRGPAGFPGWATVLVSAAILAVLVAGVALVARKLGLRRSLSWFFALGVGLWLAAPFAADTAAGGLLAAAGLVLMLAAIAAEILLRRRDLDADTIP